MEPQRHYIWVWADNGTRTLYVAHGTDLDQVRAKYPTVPVSPPHRAYFKLTPPTEEDWTMLRNIGDNIKIVFLTEHETQPNRTFKFL